MTCFVIEQTGTGKQEDAFENIGYTLFVGVAKQELVAPLCFPCFLFDALFIERQTEQEAKVQGGIGHGHKVPGAGNNTQCNVKKLRR